MTREVTQTMAPIQLSNIRPEATMVFQKVLEIQGDTVIAIKTTLHRIPKDFQEERP